MDYRKLNSVTKKDVYLLQLIEEYIDTMFGNEWFSKLDANLANYQIKVKDSDKEKTAFVTKYGLFQFPRMSFVLCNAPNVFKTHQVHMERDYGVKIHATEYEIGDFVYVLDSVKTK